MKNIVTSKEINKLAIPALFAGVAEPLLSIIDTAFVGHLPDLATESLAAVGLVGVFLSMLIWILGQTRSAISTVISQYLGANKLEKVANLPAQAIYSVVLLSILIIAVSFPLADTIFRLYNADGILLDLSVQYFQIRIFGLPFTLFTFAVFGTFRGLQNTSYPMLIAFVGLSVNVALDYVLIYGIADIIPALHIRGAAYASIVAQVIMAMLATYLLFKKTTIRLKLQFPINHEMGNLIRMIGNLFIRTIALNVALYLGSAYATKYGNTSIAAYTIAIQIWFFFAFVLDGYASAGNIISGRLYGEKSYKNLKKLSVKLVKYSVGLSTILAVLSFIFYESIGRFFIVENDVLTQFYSIFWIVILMQPINAVAFLFDGIFKGLGFMGYLRNVLLLATFIGFVPVLLVLDYFDFKLYGIWIAFTVWMLLRASILLYKFKHLPIFENEKAVF